MKTVESQSIPEDVITDIFTRLPVKSLMRFKSINKTWRDSISSSTFATLHYHRNKDKPSSYISMSETRMQLYSKDGIHRANLHRSFMPESNKYGRLIHGFIVGSSSNGLVCVKTSRYLLSLAIWNPATRESRYIPELCEPKHCNECIGFDVRPCGEYRVMVIRFSYSGVAKSYMFSKSNKCWKEISDDEEVPVWSKKVAHDKVVTLDGSMYWPVYRNEGEEDEGVTKLYLDVACFDMWEEKYRLITGASYTERILNGYAWIRLGIINGSLGYFCQGKSYCTLDGWVMNGHDRSWSKYFSLIPDPARSLPEFESDGEVEMIVFDGLICFYNHSTKQIGALPRLADHLDAVEYKESLFSVY